MSKPQSGSIDAVKSLVRGAGLRCTAARLAVLEHMLTAPGPKTHAEVSEALDHRGFDRATIYRNLTELTEATLVTRVDLGDHVSCLDDVNVAITPRPAADHPPGGAGGATGRKAAKKQASGRRQGIPAVTEVLLKGTCENCE